MNAKLICFIGGMAACAALCALGCCPKGREWREKAMEKGREAKRKAHETWEKIRREAKERMSSAAPAAAQSDAR